MCSIGVFMCLVEVIAERLAGWRDKGKDVLTVSAYWKVFYVGQADLFWGGNCDIITEINTPVSRSFFPFSLGK